MNYFVENGYITQMSCGDNFSYVLNDSCNFSSTEYKVLQSQSNSFFVKCMKMLYNGNVQLYYLTSGYKPLISMIPSMDAESFMIIASNLIADIVDVKNNGFLSCQNLDISFEHIYVDPATYKVSLLYLPISQRMFPDYISFENELRTELVKLIQNNNNFTSPKTMQFVSNLSNGSMTLENLYISVKGGSTGEFIPQQPKPLNDPRYDISSYSSSKMKLVAINAPVRVEINITKNDFIIGKKPDIVDGVISFNKMISRSHCRVVKNAGQYMIVDLQSANGTYINGVRLQPNKTVHVNNGDIIRMANSDFQVVIS